jgi:hypothetical protein
MLPRAPVAYIIIKKRLSVWSREIIGEILKIPFVSQVMPYFSRLSTDFSLRYLWFSPRWLDVRLVAERMILQKVPLRVSSTSLCYSLFHNFLRILLLLRVEVYHGPEQTPSVFQIGFHTRPSTWLVTDYGGFTSYFTENTAYPLQRTVD